MVDPPHYKILDVESKLLARKVIHLDDTFGPDLFLKGEVAKSNEQ